MPSDGPMPVDGGRGENSTRHSDVEAIGAFVRHFSVSPAAVPDMTAQLLSDLRECADSDGSWCVKLCNDDAATLLTELKRLRQERDEAVAALQPFAAIDLEAPYGSILVSHLDVLRARRVLEPPDA